MTADYTPPLSKPANTTCCWTGKQRAAGKVSNCWDARVAAVPALMQIMMQSRNRPIQDFSREDHGKLHVVSIRPDNCSRRQRPPERELRALLLCCNSRPSPCQLSITCSCDTVTLYLCTPAYLVSIRLIRLIPHLSHAELQPWTVLLLIAHFWTKNWSWAYFATDRELKNERTLDNVTSAKSRAHTHTHTHTHIHKVTEL